jgi:hypothetical protein
MFYMLQNTNFLILDLAFIMLFFIHKFTNIQPENIIYKGSNDWSFKYFLYTEIKNL